MRTHFYPIHEYGMLIDESVAAFVNQGPDHIKESARKIWHTIGPIQGEKPVLSLEDLEYVDPDVATDNLREKFNIEVSVTSEFSGYAESISNGDIAEFADDMLVFIPLDHSPSLFAAAYDSIEDIVGELKKKFADILPADFDYASHVCKISGTSYYC